MEDDDSEEAQFVIDDLIKNCKNQYEIIHDD